MSAAITEPAAEVESDKVKIHDADWGLLPHRTDLRDEFNAADLNPAFDGNPGFDWESVFANCDGESDESTRNAMADDEVRRTAYALSAKLLSRVIDWLLEVNLQHHLALKSIGVRAVVMAWVINPARFDGASLTILAKSLGYRSGKAMSPEAADFSRQFGITNKYQTHTPHKETIYETPTTEN